MDLNTVQKLDALNARFYRKIAEDFNQTRSFYWHGWREFLPYLQLLVAEREQLNVLDIGCGNGRFGKFVFDYLPAVPISYTGIDNNQQLLELADTKLKQTHLDVELKPVNIVKALIDKNFATQLTPKYNVIVLFGVLHHVPSLKLRKKLMSELKSILVDGGIIILTLWRFLDSKKLQNKLKSFDQLSIDQSQLEPNDYLLSWQRGSTAYRYCHYTDREEERELVAVSGLKIIDTFESDGKEGRGNKYLVLSKNFTTKKNKL